MSCKIDFKWNCCNGTKIIDRTFPGILSGKVSNGEWNAFCEQIDKAIVLSAMTKNMIGIQLASFVGFVITNAIFPSILIDNTKTAFIFGTVFSIHGLILLCNLKAEGMQIEGEVKSILTAESNKRAEVSFHLRKEHYSTGWGENRTTRVHTYIECFVGTGTGGDSSMLEQGLVPTATAVVATAVVVPPTTSILSNLAGLSAGAGSGPSTAQRLQDLEGIKALMCEEEYNAKKKDILDSI